MTNTIDVNTDVKPEKPVSDSSLKFIFMFLGVVLLAVLILTNLWIDRAKIILVVFMLSASVPCFWVFFNRHRIFEELCRQEVLAERARDDSMFEMTATRARLSAIEERLTRTRQPPDPDKINKLLLQQASTAVMMVIQKEQSFIKWGLWGAKLAKSAYDYLKNRSNN